MGVGRGQGGSHASPLPKDFLTKSKLKEKRRKCIQQTRAAEIKSILNVLPSVFECRKLTITGRSAKIYSQMI
jgi:hypothetical protein